MPPLINPTQTGAYPRDDNGNAVTGLGLMTIDSQTLTASGATAAVPIFGITGTVLVNALYGIVTTALGNNTAAYWRLNDSSAQSDITLNVGTALTNAVAGASIVKKGLAAAALTKLDATQERVSEPTTLETPYFSPFVAQQKTGGVATNIEFVYTTSDTPTSGAIQFFIFWQPLSSGAKIVAL